jgi:hypothetical protein
LKRKTGRVAYFSKYVCIFAPQKQIYANTITSNYYTKNKTMMKRSLFRSATLAVLMAAISSQQAMGQQSSQQDIDWMQEITSRVTFNGYAQAGWSYQDPNGMKTNSYNLKRTLLWAKARITDRW